jgi:hypothetical protein
MRHEQEYDDMNYRDRDRFREERNRRPEHLQDARSRWGEPDPRMGPHNDEWRRADEERRQHDFAHRQDWRPFEQRSNRHFQNEDRNRYGYRNEQQGRQQHNDSYRGYNQQADDRWDQHNEMSQHHHPRHASERFYREQRRRNW